MLSQPFQDGDVEGLGGTAAYVLSLLGKGERTGDGDRNAGDEEDADGGVEAAGPHPDEAEAAEEEVPEQREVPTRGTASLTGKGWNFLGGQAAEVGHVESCRQEPRRGE